MDECSWHCEGVGKREGDDTAEENKGGPQRGEEDMSGREKRNLFKTCLFSLTLKHNTDTFPWRPHRHDARSKNVFRHGGGLPRFKGNCFVKDYLQETQAVLRRRSSHDCFVWWSQVSYLAHASNPRHNGVVKEVEFFPRLAKKEVNLVIVTNRVSYWLTLLDVRRPNKDGIC